FSVAAGSKHAPASAVMVGRTKHYGGPFRITTEADLFGEEFEVAVVTTNSRLAYLGLLPLAWMERLRGRSKVRFWKTKQLRCEAIADPRVHVQVDGESFGRLPVEFEIVPDSLTIVLPWRKKNCH
ncbi:MAG: diacylglycerol/lipid kinase family protein, partial [Burkholderiales bacterium]